MKRKNKMPCEDAMFTNPVASNTECTGMTPTVPDGNYEAASYNDLYDLPVSHRELREYYDSLPPRIQKRIAESGQRFDSVWKLEEFVDSLK